MLAARHLRRDLAGGARPHAHARLRHRVAVAPARRCPSCPIVGAHRRPLRPARRHPAVHPGLPDRLVPARVGGRVHQRTTSSGSTSRRAPRPRSASAGSRATRRSSSCATSTSATTRRRCCSASTSRSPTARSSPCSAPTAPASRRCSGRSPACTPAHRRRGHLRRPRHHGADPVTDRVASASRQVPGRARRSSRRSPSPRTCGSPAGCTATTRRTSTAPPSEVLDHFPVLRDAVDDAAPATCPAASSRCSASAQAFIARPKLLMIDELSLGLAPTVVEPAARDRPRDPRQRHDDRARRAVGEHRAASWPSGPCSSRRARCASRVRPPSCSIATDILRSVFLQGRRRHVDRRRGNGERAHAPATPIAAEARRRRSSLEAAALTKRYGGITRRRPTSSFELHEGEILGLIGPNGAGKTTIFDLISGLPAPRRRPGAARRRRRHDVAGPRPGPRRPRPVVPGRPAVAVAARCARRSPPALERHVEVRAPLPAFLGLPVVARLRGARSRAGSRS